MCSVLKNLTAFIAMNLLEKIVKSAQKKAEKSTKEKNFENLQKAWLLLKNVTGAGDACVFCAKIKFEEKDYEEFFFFDLVSKKKTKLDKTVALAIKAMNVLPDEERVDFIIDEIKKHLNKTFGEKAYLFNDSTCVFVDIPNKIIGIICILENNNYRIINTFEF